ncbi:MAG: helix-turn-helix domain-containing protein [Muribaculaceae bacterium]|nr:helix-turn-helix domain-containing protein [Muribaculaceae bacterium]
MLFSEHIRLRRKELGMKQRVLADAIGVDVPMYSRYEHGERHPKREQVLKLARLLKTDAGELVALWLAEEALNAIGHDKMSVRASQLLLNVLDKTQAPVEPQADPKCIDASAVPVEAAPAVDPTLMKAPELPAGSRNLIAKLSPSGMPHYEQGDARQVMALIEDESVDCIVTTPPYWHLRRNESLSCDTIDEFIDEVLRVMAEAHRVLKPQGSLWLNMADAYEDHALQAIPWRIAIKMMDLQGWRMRNDVVWRSRQNASDNTHTHLRNTHEYLFHFVKNQDFYYNPDELRRLFNEVSKMGVKGLMPADVWDIPSEKSPIERYNVAPELLCRLPIVATCPEKGLVLDPYCGTGTTCKAAYDLNRRSLGIDINPERLRLARGRVEQKPLSLF